MPWIKGTELSAELRREALNRFIYRPTVENKKAHPKMFAKDGVMSSLKLKLVTDEEWLEQTKFHVLKDGSRLNRTTRHCYYTPKVQYVPEVKK